MCFGLSQNWHHIHKGTCFLHIDPIWPGVDKLSYLEHDVWKIAEDFIYCLASYSLHRSIAQSIPRSSLLKPLKTGLRPCSSFLYGFLTEELSWGLFDKGCSLMKYLSSRKTFDLEQQTKRNILRLDVCVPSVHQIGRQFSCHWHIPPDRWTLRLAYWTATEQFTYDRKFGEASNFLVPVVPSSHSWTTGDLADWDVFIPILSIIDDETP